jgi:hypothetical protein
MWGSAPDTPQAQPVFAGLRPYQALKNFLFNISLSLIEKSKYSLIG